MVTATTNLVKEEISHMLAAYHGILNMRKITCQKELRVSYVSFHVPEVNDVTLREIRTPELVFEPGVLSLSWSLKGWKDINYQVLTTVCQN
jgi:hypothetical protein